MHPPGRGSSFIACRPRGVLKKGGCTPRQSSDPPILEQGTAGWVGHQSLDKTRRVKRFPRGGPKCPSPSRARPRDAAKKRMVGAGWVGPPSAHPSAESSIIFNHIIRISRRDPYLSKWMMGRGPGCERAGWGRDPNHPEETRRPTLCVLSTPSVQAPSLLQFHSTPPRKSYPQLLFFESSAFPIRPRRRRPAPPPPISQF